MKSKDKKRGIIVIGIGNPNFKDDGIGLKVIEELEKIGVKNVVKYLNMDLKIIDSLCGYKKAIIVDAVKTGATPGTIFEFDAKNTWCNIYASGTHSMSIFEIIRIGCYIFSEEMPDEIKIIAIEGKEVLSLGKNISSNIKKIIPKVVEKILKEVREYQ